MTPAGGHYTLGTPVGAWIVLLGGMAFFLLLAGYVQTLLTNEAGIRGQVEARTRELALETESHLRDAQALRESEARFRHLLEVMGEGLWGLDRQGATTFVNRRMAEMLGYTPTEMVGRSLFEFMAEADIPQAQRNMADRRDGQGAQHDFRFLRKDGSELWTIVTGTPVLDESGQVVSILGVVTDITERRRQEQAQLQGQKLESLGVLAGGIAHDFNNLLTAILGNINLAQLCLPKLSPAWPYLENVERTVQCATNLTRQMLAYSGKGRFVVGPLDLNRLVEEMAHLLSGSIRTGTQTYGPELLAREFPGQSLEPGSFITLEVSDTGQGMAPEVQARIFEPFFTTKFTGRGLGLSAMQGIVRGHHGGIRVYSEIGQGTTFKLIFPVGTGEAPGEAEPQLEDAWTGHGTVLVVDDEESVRLVAAELPRSMGFDVIMANDGLEALDRFRESTVPLQAVLMDLTMPRLDGVETFRELRRIDPGCRVVLTSGYNEQEAIQDFLGKGLVAFVQKPFLRGEMLQAMRKALGG